MKVTLAQLNPTVGDVSGNLQKVLDVLEQHGGSTDLIVFSELFLVGYPPRDLVEKALPHQPGAAGSGPVAGGLGRYPGAAVLLGAPLAHRPGHRQGAERRRGLNRPGKAAVSAKQVAAPHLRRLR